MRVMGAYLNHPLIKQSAHLLMDYRHPKKLVLWEEI